MKRADIEAGHVYGFNESTSHIYCYQPYLVISTDLYMIPRYGDRKLVPADQGHNTITSGRSSYGNAVGLLTVHLTEHGEADVDRVRDLATATSAMAGINGDGRDITDGINPRTGLPVILGRYRLLTNLRYLHGDYAELTAELAARERETKRLDEQVEAKRRRNLATYRSLEARLSALGITGYAVRHYEDPTRFEGLRFEDMDALLDLAEAADLRRMDDTPFEV